MSKIPIPLVLLVLVVVIGLIVLLAPILERREFAADVADCVSHGYEQHFCEDFLAAQKTRMGSSRYGAAPQP